MSASASSSSVPPSDESGDPELKTLLLSLIQAQDEMKALNPPERTKQLKQLRLNIKDLKDKLGIKMTQHDLTCLKLGTHALHSRVSKVKPSWNDVIQPALEEYNKQAKVFNPQEAAAFITNWRNAEEHAQPKSTLTLRKQTAQQKPAKKRKQPSQASQPDGEETQPDEDEFSDDESPVGGKKGKKDVALYLV